MWIAVPMYERLPQVWFLLGLLFISNGLYLGLDFKLAFGYLGVGLISCIYGIGIALFRWRYRRAKSDGEESVDLDPPNPT
jgi:hypothetical protein